MKAYDPKAKCPKCGNDSASTAYMPGAFRIVPPDIPDEVLHPIYWDREPHRERVKEELMRRECLRCGYTWDEAPLDKDD